MYAQKFTIPLEVNIRTRQFLTRYFDVSGSDVSAPSLLFHIDTVT